MMSVFGQVSRKCEISWSEISTQCNNDSLPLQHLRYSSWVA